jgi:hypothetical protein
MSGNRNARLDHEHTVALLQQITAGNAAPTGSPTWLDHGGRQNARVDLALLVGSNLKNINGVTKSRAMDHVRHLRQVHGLEVEQVGDMYRFALQRP